jgi:hypothetical protein
VPTQPLAPTSLLERASTLSSHAYIPIRLDGLGRLPWSGKLVRFQDRAAPDATLPSSLAHLASSAAWVEHFFVLWRGSLLEFESDDQSSSSVATHQVCGGTATRVPRASGHRAKYVFKLSQPSSSQYVLRYLFERHPSLSARWPAISSVVGWCC